MLNSIIIKNLRDGKQSFSKKRNDEILYPLDDSWVVPYNPYLLLKYRTHINVEIVTNANLVKYLCKYVFKGQSKVMMRADQIASLPEPSTITVVLGSVFASTASCSMPSS